jgi:hypothetical protein
MNRFDELGSVAGSVWIQRQFEGMNHGLNQGAVAAMTVVIGRGVFWRIILDEKSSSEQLGR